MTSAWPRVESAWLSNAFNFLKVKRFQSFCFQLSTCAPTPWLFAPQELYLLHFYTMDERRRRLSGAELEGWIFEGLRKVGR